MTGRSLWFALAFWFVCVVVLMLYAGALWIRLRNRVLWRDEEMRIVSDPPATSATRERASRPDRSG